VNGKHISLLEGRGDDLPFVVGERTPDREAAPYGGSRFPIDARLARRSFVSFRLLVFDGW
jgi:hypothetical protein